MMEVLPLAACNTMLTSSSGSPTPQELEKILDSVTVHIQGSHAQVNAEEVAEIVDALKKPIKSLLSKVGTLEKEQKELQRKYDDLQRKYKELESALLVGQIASHFERILLERILDGTSVSPDYATFKKLEKALQFDNLGRNRTGMHLTDREKKTAGKNWDDWDDKLQLDDDLYGSHGQLKKYRNNKAHPKLDHDIMHSCLAQLEGKDKMQVEKMIQVIERLEGDN
uniref:Uncharacterized protein n=1 Tax=Amphimedon queenslandica TaxID=400682 RepID=A0A1X7UGU8_AMPQE